MLRCNEVTRLVASGDADHAGVFRRVQLWLHLQMCEHCRRYVAQMRAIGRAARELLGAGSEDPLVLRRLEKTFLEEVRRRVR